MSEALNQFGTSLIKEIAKVHQSSRLEAMMESIGADMKEMKSDLKQIKDSKTDDAVWKAKQEGRLCEGNKRFEAIHLELLKLEENKLDKKTVFWVGVGFLLANGGLTATIVKMLMP